VQDQVSGQEIVRGLKVGHFFPLQSSSFSCSISFSYSTIVNKIANFGIINWVIPIILTHLIKHFDHSSCCVQDQVWGQEIARGPKVGHFFPLQSSSFSCSISFSYSTIVNKIANFGIINWVVPIILTHLIKQDYLNNTNEFSSLLFDCALCKLGESKFLPFSLQIVMLLHVLKLFILIFGV